MNPVILWTYFAFSRGRFYLLSLNLYEKINKYNLQSQIKRFLRFYSLNYYFCHTSSPINFKHLVFFVRIFHQFRWIIFFLQMKWKFYPQKISLSQKYVEVKSWFHKLKNYFLSINMENSDKLCIISWVVDEWNVRVVSAIHIDSLCGFYLLISIQKNWDQISKRRNENDLRSAVN